MRPRRLLSTTQAHASPLSALLLLPFVCCLSSPSCALFRREPPKKPEVELTPPSPDPSPPPAPKPGFAVALAGGVAVKLEGETLSLFDLSQGAEATPKALPLPAGDAQVLTLLPQGIGLGYPDGSVVAWDLQGPKKLLTLPGKGGAIVALAATQDGKQLLTGDTEGKVALFDLTSGALLYELSGHKGKITFLAVSVDGAKAISASEDATLKVWDLKKGTLLRTLTGHTRSVWSAALSPDGRYAVSASADGTAKGWDVETGREIFTRIGTVRFLAAREDSTRVLVIRAEELAVWEISTGVELASIPIPSTTPLAAAFSTDKTHALLFDQSGALSTFSLPTEIAPEPF